MPIYVIIVDGAGDLPISSLGGLTPWEAAQTPTLDAMAKNGLQGLIDVVPGIAPESDNGCMALLGYDPHAYYTGRGPLEGLGAGFLSHGGHPVCFRINFASWSPETGRLSRRTSRGISNFELQALADEIRSKVTLNADFPVKFELQAYGGYRGLLSINSASYPLGYAVSNTDPLFRKSGVFGVPDLDAELVPGTCEPLSGAAADAATAKLVNQFVASAARVLNASQVNKARIIQGKDPANYILVRDAGGPPRDMPSFRQRFGLTLSFHGQIAAEAGLMKLLGGAFVSAVPRDGEANRDFFSRMAASLIGDAADVRCIHFVKDADEAGHDGNPAAKIRALEEFDEYFLQPLIKRIGLDSTIVITSDHATPCGLGIHSVDPVPTLVLGLGADGTPSFGETASRDGDLRVKVGCELLPWVISNRHSL